MSHKAKIEVIIPFASSKVVKDWLKASHMLQQTLSSVLALPEEFVSISIYGHESPENLPSSPRCRWVTVDWDAPAQDDFAGKRNDKGMKVRLGVREAFSRGMEWVMFVDGDDLLSSRLPSICDLDGYDAICFESGYSWRVGSSSLNLIPKFHRVCGTSWIMKCTPRLFPMWIGDGSHRVCDVAHNLRFDGLMSEGLRIQRVKHPVAIYCIGYSNTGHGELLGSRVESGFSSIIELFKASVKRITRSKRLNPRLRVEFGIPD